MSFNPPPHELAKVFFGVGFFWVAVRVGWWIIVERHWANLLTAMTVSFVVFGLIGSLSVLSILWVASRQARTNPIPTSIRTASEAAHPLSAQEIAEPDPSISAAQKELPTGDCGHDFDWWAGFGACPACYHDARARVKVLEQMLDDREGKAHE